MRFWQLIQKNLVRRTSRSLLTLFALSTAIGAVVALLGIAKGFTKSFADVYRAHAVDIVVSRQGSADRLSSAVDESMVGTIENLDAVERAAAVLLETLSLEDEGVYGIPTLGIKKDSWLLDDYEMVQEEHPSRSQNDSGDAENSEFERSLWVGIHLADRLEVAAGDNVRLFDEPYKIRGVYSSASTWENGSMIVPLDTLQELTDRSGQATYINVVLRQPVTGQLAETAIQQIAALDSRLLPLATDEFVETDTRMQLAGAMAWMTSGIALIIGAIGTLNTMLTSVLERTKEIGILRAIGWPRRRVIRMILCESLGLAFLAAVLGTLFALLMTWLLSQAPEAKGLLDPAIDQVVILEGFLLAMGIGVLGALLPAWRAAQMLPTEAFRES